MKTTTAKLMSALVVVGLLACGVVAGIAIERAWLSSEPSATQTDRGTDRFLRRFRHRLNLNDEQESRIRDILIKSRTRALEIRRSSRAEIMSVLNPEQRARFERIIQRRNDRRRNRRDRRRPRNRRF